jgi:ArsR family transcriptional regulator
LGVYTSGGFGVATIWRLPGRFVFEFQVTGPGRGPRRAGVGRGGTIDSLRLGPAEDAALMNHSTVLKPRPSKGAALPVAAPIKVSEPTLQQLSKVFKLLADENRLRIVLALAQDSELHVSALCELLDQSQPAVSHHLTLMRLTGLVGYRRDGKHNYYHLASGFMRELLERFFSDSGNGQRQLQFEDFALSFKRR